MQRGNIVENFFQVYIFIQNLHDIVEISTFAKEIVVILQCETKK